MKYKIGDQVTVQVEVQKSGAKKILTWPAKKDSKIINKSFIIIAKYDSSYSVAIDDDMLGWTINNFHIDHHKVNKKYLGQKFSDINDEMIVK